MSLNLKQVKGNFQRLFDKNLTDLVRGLRNNKDNEVGEVSRNKILTVFHALFAIFIPITNFISTKMIHISTFSNFLFHSMNAGKLYRSVHRGD